MSACKKVKKWITKKVQIPVEKAIKKAKKQCTEVKKKIEEKVKKPIEEWVSKRVEKCKKKKCKKWCLCCNKWFCWIETILEKIITYVIVTVIKWVTYLVCKIVMIVVDIIVKIVIRLLKFLVTFLVCIFTDPLEALKAIWALWKDLLDIIEDLFDFIKSLVCDLIEFINDFKGLTCGLAQSFSYVGLVLFGFVDGGLSLVQQLIETVCNFLNGVKDVVFGILNLNGCRLSGGLTNIGVGIARIILDIIGAPGWILVSGIASNVRKMKLKKIIESSLSQAFPEDENRINRIKDKMHFYACPMGLPVELDARRMCIPSGRYLRELHIRGQINLFALAGQINGCDDKKWATQTSSVLGEVVYEGTDIRVSYFDLKRFIDEGPDAIAPFNVYPIRLERFENFLRIAQTKAYQLGLAFSWGEIIDYPIDREQDPNFQFVPMDQSVHENVFTDFPRSGINDALCKVPTLAIFRYLNDDPSYGLTSWFRPPPYQTPCSGQIDDTIPYPYRSKSGVSFTDRIPEFVFGTVLVHELGHYFGLCHDNHNGLEYIMYVPRSAESHVTGNTFSEYLLLSGGPSFTLDDAKETWRWLTNVADDSCLFPEI
ncbi:zinc metalloprotease [Membranihabitans marinus]|uniref:hypothetical protein n=1 Tax=Membranihabitans marinus TaxID=1227546 RepID=UPI001F409EEE|nr:hypothetical protein [Membranihabitans marinus]